MGLGRASRKQGALISVLSSPPLSGGSTVLRAADFGTSQPASHHLTLRISLDRVTYISTEKIH